ncbi:VOC family protein [Schumannella sp. 10F1B-5-1]|uniref:VOC family protein n=1 Tax=Schumannella sp. 10F1B-5-1 TaxID=2590780 RepID=UPI001C63D975|nr:VOC family protein [Schumannella sp. 10F1B-5-1]
MSDGGAVKITNKQFHENEGVADWRVLFWGAHVFYRTSGFAEGARLVVAIAEAAAELGHEPDVDIRPEGVTVRSRTLPDGELSTADVALAQRVSAAAHELGLEPDPTALTVVGIAVAEDDHVDTRPFWRAALGYVDLGEEDAVDPLRRNPHTWFHKLRPSKPGRGRTHIDVSVPADQVEARVAACVAAGGRIVNDHVAPNSYTIASPDNHGIDIAGWADHYEN